MMMDAMLILQMAMVSAINSIDNYECNADLTNNDRCTIDSTDNDECNVDSINGDRCNVNFTNNDVDNDVVIATSQ